MQYFKLLFISLFFTVTVSADYVVLTIKSEADAVQAAIDTAAGYPRNGVDVGKGIHVPAAQSRTLHQFDVVKHPVNNEWSVKVDGFPAKVPVGKTTVATLPTDWHLKNAVVEASK